MWYHFSRYYTRYFILLMIIKRFLLNWWSATIAQIRLQDGCDVCPSLKTFLQTKNKGKSQRFHVHFFSRLSHWGQTLWCFFFVRNKITWASECSTQQRQQGYSTKIHSEDIEWNSPHMNMNIMKEYRQIMFIRGECTVVSSRYCWSSHLFKSILHPHVWISWFNDLN